jgi:hypothetical protein
MDSNHRSPAGAVSLTYAKRPRTSCAPNSLIGNHTGGPCHDVEFWLEGFVVTRTKFRIAAFAGPSFRQQPRRLLLRQACAGGWSSWSTCGPPRSSSAPSTGQLDARPSPLARDRRSRRTGLHSPGRVAEAKLPTRHTYAEATMIKRSLYKLSLRQFYPLRPSRPAGRDYARCGAGNRRAAAAHGLAP